MIKPILFNTGMVISILDDRKDTTRRIVKSHEQPPTSIGDILYVRETIWQKVGRYLDVDGETKSVFVPEFKYVATDEKPETGWNYSWAKRPSIHMPKEAARIWLIVTDVRMERLQDMTLDDFLNEGISIPYEAFSDPENAYMQAKKTFKHIWNSTINKKQFNLYEWDANPLVWVIEFARCKKEIIRSMQPRKGV